MVWIVFILFSFPFVAIVWFEFSLLFKRINNADARILRLEQVEDRRHAFDKTMADKASDTIKLRCKPDPTCKHCHGRGHIGKNTETGLFIVCTCCG